MQKLLHLGDIAVYVVLKNIKNIHLSVHPPEGHVRISAPSRMSLETIRSFAISKLAWIKRQQEKLRQQGRETPREYVDDESHSVWGTRYLLKIVECEHTPMVALTHSHVVLYVRAGTDAAAKESLVAQWYREQLRSAVPELIAKWEPLLGVTVGRVFVRQMKTRWGTCNPRTRTIRLNTELARKPMECLEYIVVHEMVHIIEPSHNARFVALMHHFMPQWQLRRQRLNRMPVRHADWEH